MTEMKVSIITLTYNNIHLIKNAIESVFNQNFDENLKLEYLIVDDASSNFDESEVNSILSQYTDKAIEVKIIQNPINLGTVKSFNNAIRLALGDIIIPLSADDEFYDQNSLSKISNIFKDEDVNIATGKAIITNSDSGAWVGEFPPAHKLFLFEPNKKSNLLEYLCLKGNIITGAATYYRKSYFIDIGGFDEQYRLLEDYPFYLKVLDSGQSIKLINDFVLKYRDGGISTNKKKINPLLDKDFDILTKNILQMPFLSKQQKNFIFYKRFVKRREKVALKSVFKYPIETLKYIYEYLLKIYARIF